VGSHSFSRAGVISGRTAPMRVSSMRVVSWVEGGVAVAWTWVFMAGLSVFLASSQRRMVISSYEFRSIYGGNARRPRAFWRPVLSVFLELIGVGLDLVNE
jgi:hypothetical protein